MERLVTRAIILDENKRVLVGKRAKDAGANQWALVGGKPEEDETLIDAVGREVEEELRVKFVNVQFYLERVDSDTDPISPWRVHFFTGKIIGTINPKVDEILEVMYISQEDLDKFDIAFDHRERLKEFFKSVL